MSLTGPIKVLHEAEGHIVTCETVTGEVYRGRLVEAEDNMNCQISMVTVSYRNGTTRNMDNVYIRGSKIKFLILPDMLMNAPMFRRQGFNTGRGLAGRGKPVHRMRGFGAGSSGYRPQGNRPVERSHDRDSYGRSGAAGRRQ